MVDEKVIDTQDLLLDRKNYRIDFKRYTTLDEAVRRLYLDEEIVEMIEGIVEFPGLYPHEKLIVIPNGNGKYIVKEGNRRVLAAKSLLGEISPPPSHKRKVETLKSKMSEEDLLSLKQMGAVIYEMDDKAYMKILANKHAKIGYKNWGQISQWAYFSDLYDLNNKDMELTASDLGRKKSEIKSFIQNYKLFSYIRELTYWDEEHLREKIESNNLDATKFTRPLGWTDVKKALGIEFGDDLELKVPSESKDKFDEILCRYARASLISTKKEEDYIFTRTESADVLSLINSWKQESTHSTTGNEVEPETPSVASNGSETTGSGTTTGGEGRNGSTGRNTSTKHKKPAVYFEDLKCSVEEQRLKRITTELIELSKQKRMEKFTVCGTMLSRALLESCLRYQVNKKGKMGEYLKSLEYEKEGKTHISQPGLKNMVSFALKNVENLFKKSNAKNARKALEQITNIHLDYMNGIVHESWSDPTPGKIHDFAGDIREMLKAILSDTA